MSSDGVQVVSNKSTSRFLSLAWVVLGYTVIVIMWGAFVRATGSGAGCGEHWPLCNGEVIPRAPSLSRVIEFSHRLSSGLSLVLVVAMVWFGRRLFPPGHQARRAVHWSLVFILGEALVGAALVLLRLVAHDDSVLRAIVIALHLLNTFLLLYWLSQVAFLARKQRDNSATRGMEQAQTSTQTPKATGVLGASLSRAKLNIGLCLVAFALTGAAGAIVALGDTLFPAVNLQEGLTQDFSPTAHFLIKLRMWHPLLAVFAATYILIQAIALPKVFRNLISPRLSYLVASLIVCQFLGGIINWLLLAPVWMQLFHLMLADITWITMCFWYFGVSQMNSYKPSSAS